MSAAVRTSLALKVESVFVKTFSHIGQYNIILKKFNKLKLKADIYNMGKKASKKSKAKIKEAKQPLKLKRSTVLTIVAALALIAVISGIFIIRAVIQKKINDRTVRIAFYGLSDDLCALIQEQAPQLDEVIFSFDKIPEDDVDIDILNNKYDMLFSWKGQVTDSIASSAQDISSKMLERIPRSLRNKKCMPILLDYFEIAFETSLASELGYNIENGYNSFQKYLEVTKSHVFSPFFANGGDDRILLALTGCMIESFGGIPAYDKFIELIKAGTEFNTLLDEKLDTDGLTLKKVLDELKAMPQDGKTHPEWYNGKNQDLFYFAKSKQIAVYFALLSEHRNFDYEVIRNFESVYFPKRKPKVNHALMAPQLSCVLISNNSNAEKYLKNLTELEVQSKLSNKTKLASVHYHAECYDRQADDLRYWAAANAGVISDPALAAFQRDKAAMTAFASEIRQYLRMR